MDEWIKGVSDRKLELNTKFKSVFDKATVEISHIPEHHNIHIA